MLGSNKHHDAFIIIALYCRHMTEKFYPVAKRNENEALTTFKKTLKIQTGNIAGIKNDVPFLSNGIFAVGGRFFNKTGK